MRPLTGEKESQLKFAMKELLDALEGSMGEPGDFTSALQHIAQTAKTLFAADACVIFAINPVSNHFIGSLTVAGNLLEKINLSYKQPRPEGIAPQVLKRGVLLVEDLEVAPEYHSIFTRSEGIRSFAGLALSMKHSQKPLGVLYLNFRQLQQFSTDDHELFQFFADQASIILQETWLLRRYQEVARIGQEINHELDTVDNLFRKLQKYLPEILDVSYTLLLAVYQPQTNTLDFYMTEGEQSIFQFNSSLEGVYQYVIERRQMLFIKHLSKEAKHLPFRYSEISTETGPKKSLIFVPLELRDIALGALSIQHPQPNAYNQEDLSILQLLASHIALALHNMRLYNSLDQLNKTGQLLTQQLDSEQALQATVDKIRDATKADIVVLYPYEPTFRRFVLPPIMAGTLLDSTIHSMSLSQPDDTMTLMLHRDEPIFAKNSATFYTKLHGNLHIWQGSFGQREKVRSIAAIPLQVGDELVGVLFVNFRQPQHFDATQKLFIDGLAHYAAVAIKNARVFGTIIHRRVRELEILQNIDREISRNLELGSVLDTLLKLAYEQVPADGASILLYNSRTQALVTAAAIGLHAEFPQASIIPLQATRGITRWVLEQKKPARVHNVHLDSLWRDIYIPTAAETVSELDVPLLDGEEVVGVLNFESTREGAFLQEDEDFLLTLAGQAVLAVKNAQAYEREKRLAAEAQVLNEISREITSQLDFAYIFDLILEKALELTHSNLGNLMLYDPNKHDLWMAAERGVAEDKKGLRQRLDQGVVGQAARSKKLLNVDLTQKGWSEIYLEFFPGALSELAVPMLAGNEIRGVLNVESPVPNNFSESDERLLTGLSALAVVALQNAQAYEREKRLVAEGQLLNEISKEITSQLDPMHIFDLILEKALELTRSTLGALLLYDPYLKDLGTAAARGVSEDQKAVRLSLQQGIVGHVARNKQLVNADLSQPAWKEIYIEFVPGMRAELAVPMLAGNELRGVLYVESPSSNNFNESDERLLQGLADMAVVALQNAERYEQARQEAKRFALLYQAGQELGKISELTQLDQTYEIILHITEKYYNGQVVIRRYEDETQELVTIRTSHHQYSLPFPRLKLHEGVNGQVARERYTIVLFDTHTPPPGVAPPKLSDPTLRSLLVTPILFKERYYGNLSANHLDIGRFRDADVDFFKGLALQLASTIYRLETAQERQEFEQRAQAAEIMGSIGQSSVELTHRLGNDLGLVEFQIDEIRDELRKQDGSKAFVSEELDEIVQAVRTVLKMSKKLRYELSHSEAIEEAYGEPVVISASVLLQDARSIFPLPSNVDLSLDIAEDVGEVRVIPGSIADIFRHLIANACDAMQPGGGKITLRAYNVDRHVALEVSDTGVGIPPEKLPKIFGLFFSTKNSSGFGLWSARRKALKNRGDLKVKSLPGQGATFTLLLPIVDEGA